MKKHTKFVLLILLLFLGISDFLFGQNIKTNQIAFFTGSTKMAVVPGAETGSFYLKDATTNTTVFTGTLGTAATWAPSSESVKIADFSTFKTVGSFYVQTTNEKSNTFDIKDQKALYDLSVWTAKSFYIWRASTALDAKYATISGQSYARSAGHLDDQVLIHSSAATTARPAGTKVSAPKGWYDAGDYGLYVVNAGMSVHSLMLAYETMPKYFDTLNLNIPESGNGVPDILNELKWEYDWMLNMQDPNDGGVYFKLTSLQFDGFEMPSVDKLTRYMIGKTTTSALDFVAMTAMAARVYTKYETVFPGFAAKCLAASKSAYTWAKAHPSIAFTNPSDVGTGEYGDGTFTDEFFWAASELYITTQDATYYSDINLSISCVAPSWGDVSGCGLMSLKAHVNDLPATADKTTINSKFLTFADGIYSIYNSSAYKVPISNFYWGSNGVVASNGSVLALAFRTLKDKKYLDAMVAATDYILGRNAVNYSFVTWFGDKTPMNIHHRQSGSDGITKPCPGYLAGGPNTDAVTDCGAASYPTTTIKAKCYLDSQCSYSTNEVAINWQAPLVNLISSMEDAFSPALNDSAITNNTTSFTVYFSKSLNIATISYLTVFAVTVNGVAQTVSSVVIRTTNPNQIIVTIASSIPVGSTILYSYSGTSLTTILNNTPVTKFSGMTVKNTLTSAPVTQTISLAKGWNLVSFYVIPTNPAISTVFSSVLTNVTTIKTTDAFYDPKQTAAFNSLTTIEAGKGYLVNMAVAGTLSVTGQAVSTVAYSLKTGWNLIGYPSNTSTAITTELNSIWTSFVSVKNFDGFYIKNGTINSLTNLVPNYGYFVNVSSAGTLSLP
jgi:endoglucanase